VVDRAALSVVRGWPTADRLIRNRQVAHLLLQSALAGAVAEIHETAAGVLRPNPLLAEVRAHRATLAKHAENLFPARPPLFDPISVFMY
jgi:hypothetical protein